MHVYDTLIIGSGYSSVGYALQKKNCIICEETQCCDAHFYLPLRSFKCDEYVPVTEKGKKLNSVFNELNLFNDGLMCTNAFEPAFCKFLSDENVEILLKCRIVEFEKIDDIFKITIVSGEGLNAVYAKNIIDTTARFCEGENCLTVLFSSTEGENDIEKLSETFENATFIQAFYENRYAMHLPTKEIDNINEMLLVIEEKWKKAEVEGKVLYVAPVLYKNNVKSDKLNNFPKDFDYLNPIAAFEAGVLFAGGEQK